jgi:3-methyladenine DNA glycosylase/8-oxoguanine DNA glycosylase
MVEIAVRPSGPYSLALSARLAGDATRRVRDGLFTARCCGAVARAWQSPDGTVTVRSESAAAAEKLRWTLALDDDHTEFLRRVADDPLLGRAAKHLRGLRPVRTATVAQALLRAVCGQLIDSKTARSLERRLIRALAPPDEDGYCEPPQLEGRRSLELERLHDLPTDAVVRRLERERGLGPWSAGVVCLEGLGRFEHGLVGDLGLVKLLRALRGRPVEGWETAELLEPYGEWAGLASVYLLSGYSRGLIPLPTARAA